MRIENSEGDGGPRVSTQERQSSSGCQGKNCRLIVVGMRGVLLGRAGNVMGHEHEAQIDERVKSNNDPILE